MKNKPSNRNGRVANGIAKYLREISEFELLSPEEEVVLTRKIREGDSDALENLIKANLRFVFSVAKEYQGHGLPLQDLISEGNMGLIKAAEKFDETRGFRFISYAVWWIRQSILQALSEQSRVVRLPMNRIEAIQKIGNTADRLTREQNRETSMSEVVDSLGMDRYEVIDILEMPSRQLSLDQPLGENGSRLLDLLESNHQDSPDSFMTTESLKHEIEKALGSLKGREVEIIQLYYGLTGQPPQSLEQLGKRFKVTAERVRQIKDRALRRIRNHLFRDRHFAII